MGGTDKRIKTCVRRHSREEPRDPEAEGSLAVAPRGGCRPGRRLGPVPGQRDRQGKRGPASKRKGSHRPQVNAREGAAPEQTAPAANKHTKPHTRLLRMRQKHSSARTQANTAPGASPEREPMPINLKTVNSVHRRKCHGSHTVCCQHQEPQAPGSEATRPGSRDPTAHTLPTVGPRQTSPKTTALSKTPRGGCTLEPHAADRVTTRGSDSVDRPRGPLAHTGHWGEGVNQACWQTRLISFLLFTHTSTQLTRKQNSPEGTETPAEKGLQPLAPPPPGVLPTPRVVPANSLKRPLGSGGERRPGSSEVQI